MKCTDTLVSEEKYKKNLNILEKRDTIRTNRVVQRGGTSLKVIQSEVMSLHSKVKYEQFYVPTGKGTICHAPRFS